MRQDNTMTVQPIRILRLQPDRNDIGAALQELQNRAKFEAHRAATIGDHQAMESYLDIAAAIGCAIAVSSEQLETLRSRN